MFGVFCSRAKESAIAKIIGKLSEAKLSSQERFHEMEYNFSWRRIIWTTGMFEWTSGLPNGSHHQRPMQCKLN